MEAGKLGFWLQVVGNFGILVGLFLVILQINQNSELLRTQLLFAFSERQTNASLPMLGEDAAAVWAKSQLTPTELDLTEQQILEGYYYVQIEQWRSLYDLHVAGLIDAADWKERVTRDTSYILNNPYGLAYWNAMKETVPSALVEVIEEDIATDDLTALDYHRRIMEEAAQFAHARREPER